MKACWFLLIGAVVFLTSCSRSVPNTSLKPTVPTPIPLLPTETLIPSPTPTSPANIPTDSQITSTSSLPSPTPITDKELEDLLKDLGDLNIDDDLGELDKLY